MWPLADEMVVGGDGFGWDDLGMILVYQHVNFLTTQNIDLVGVRYSNKFQLSKVAPPKPTAWDRMIINTISSTAFRPQ